jgi:hypothetical protein
MTVQLPDVFVGFPVYATQSPMWWNQVFTMLMAGNNKYYTINKTMIASGMMSDVSKNNLVSFKRRDAMTDENRNAIAKGFMDSDADFLFVMDDDTVPPGGALARLLSLRREFVSGLYFLPKSPWHPIAYFKEKNGMYANYTGYPKGMLVEVDAVGLGCALIHRDVFTKIEETHSVFVRENGSMVTVPNRLIRNNKQTDVKEAYVKDGLLHVPLRKPDKDDDRNFPFFALEHSRTEDLIFCEMAKEAGVPIWLDTTVVCEHVKMQGTTEEDYKRGLIEESAKAINVSEI